MYMIKTIYGPQSTPGATQIPAEAPHVKIKCNRKGRFDLRFSMRNAQEFEYGFSFSFA